MASNFAYKLHILKQWNVLSENVPCYIYILLTRTVKLTKSHSEANTRKKPDVHNQISREPQISVQGNRFKENAL
jgi:hypothetical protein